MVIIDDYNRFPVVDHLTNITTQTGLQRLKIVFGLLGKPDFVKSDNGEPFNSHLFSNFADSFGFKHRNITPLHPKVNATVEDFKKS